MQTLISPSCEGFILNLASIGPVVSEKMVKEFGRRRTTEACLYCQFGLGEQKNESTNNMVSALCIVS